MTPRLQELHGNTCREPPRISDPSGRTKQNETTHAHTLGDLQTNRQTDDRHTESERETATETETEDRYWDRKTQTDRHRQTKTATDRQRQPQTDKDSRSRMFNRCENDSFCDLSEHKCNAVNHSITGTVRDVRNGVNHNSLSDDLHAVRLVIVLFVRLSVETLLGGNLHHLSPTFWIGRVSTNLRPCAQWTSTFYNSQPCHCFRLSE